MRFFRNVLCSIAALFALASFPATVYAQTYTTQMTLNNLLGTGGAVASAKVCAVAVDAYDNPLAFSAPTWGLIETNTQFCGTATAGAISGGFNLPDACHTNQPSPIYYDVTIQPTSNGLPAGATLKLNRTPVPNICGATYPLDSYTPSTIAISPPSQIVGAGTSVPSSCTSPSIWMATVSSVTTGYVCSNGVYVAFAQAGGGVTLAHDLGGTSSLPTVVGIQGVPVASTAPTNGQTLQYNGTNYVPTRANSATINSANSQVQADSVVATNVNAWVAFGDSITAGVGATIPANNYVSVISADLQIPVTNLGVSGDTSCDETARVFNNANPGNFNNPVYTSAIGTNDVTHLATSIGFQRCAMASASWLAISSADKILAGNAAVTSGGTWTADTTFSRASGLNATTAGATLSYTGAYIGPSGYFYVLYKATPTGTSAFTVSVDGVVVTDTVSGASPVTVTNAGSSFWNTAAGVAVARFAASSGSHTLLVSVITGPVTILGFEFPPTRRYRGVGVPRVVWGGIIPQQNNVSSAAIIAMNATSSSMASQLVSDGLNVPFVDLYNALDAIVDMSSTIIRTCPASGQPGLHPNDCGHRHEAGIFESYIGAAPQSNPTLVQTLNYAGAPSATDISLVNGLENATYSPSGTTFPKASQCIFTTGGYCMGMTASGTGGGPYQTTLIGPNAAQGRIAFSFTAPHATPAQVVAGSSWWFQYDGSAQLGSAAMTIDTAGGLHLPNLYMTNTLAVPQGLNVGSGTPVPFDLYNDAATKVLGIQGFGAGDVQIYACTACGTTVQFGTAAWSAAGTHHAFTEWGRFTSAGIFQADFGAAMNGAKITGLANGTAATDAVAFGQLNGPLTGNITLTAAGSDAIAITGVTTASKCSFSATNATAAGLTSTTGALWYAVAVNNFTLNHATTSAAGATFGVLCSIN